MSTTNTVEVRPYDTTWPAEFGREATLLRSIFETAVRIEHIGGTSIPGMSAKPVIDILIEVSSLADVESLTPRLEASGYVARGEQGVPGRRYFRKGTGTNHTHHVHVYESGNPGIVEHQAFRDYLATHGTRAREYASLKESLAARYREDRPSYQGGKEATARQIIAEALAWASQRRSAARFDAAETVENPPGILRTPIAFNEQVQLCHFRLAKGVRIPFHAHAAAQNGYLISGRLKMLWETGRELVAEPGSGWCFDPNERHGAEALEDCVAVECFAPLRPEYLPPG